ncbi:MAG: type I-E CRISPR-associated protein Cas6/Cse3/CasE [Deltaproteobacteria bacterium]|nr:type I-E CRISPR-associated protein Cas6/Cse3/CasE [Deltaproteobacteria bacterium]
MFASLLNLSIQDMARLRIKDAYGIHRVVYDLFDPLRGNTADGGRSASSGILYADRGLKKGWREILIVSDRSPRPAVGVRLETREIPEKLLGFPSYRFEITINPVKRDRASGKLVPLRTREAVIEWFAAKAPGWGFEPAAGHLEVESMNVAQFENKGQRVTLGQATLTGLLQVRDAARFAQSFTHGIGRGKAFGCGLLQIVPAV